MKNPIGANTGRFAEGYIPKSSHGPEPPFYFIRFLFLHFLTTTFTPLTPLPCTGCALKLALVRGRCNVASFSSFRTLFGTVKTLPVFSRRTASDSAMILQRIDHGLQHGGAGRIQECPYRMSLLSLQTQPDAKFVVLSVSLLAWRNGVLEMPHRPF